MLLYSAEKKPIGRAGVASYPAALQPIVNNETSEEARGAIAFKGMRQW